MITSLLSLFKFRCTVAKVLQEFVKLRVVLFFAEVTHRILACREDTGDIFIVTSSVDGYRFSIEKFWVDSIFRLRFLSHRGPSTLFIVKSAAVEIFLSSTFFGHPNKTFYDNKILTEEILLIFEREFYFYSLLKYYLSIRNYMHYLYLYSKILK